MGMTGGLPTLGKRKALRRGSPAPAQVVHTTSAACVLVKDFYHDQLRAMCTAHSLATCRQQIANTPDYEN
jgi:hypothetical protein